MVVIKSKSTLLAIALCLGATSAFAQDESLDSSFTVFGSMRTGGEFSEMDSDVTYDASDSSAYGLIWNTRSKRNTEWEVYFSHQPTDVERLGGIINPPKFDLDIYNLQIGGTYLFDSQGVQSYLVMTLGGAHIKADSEAGDSESYFSGSIGLGLKFFESKRVGLRLEGRVNGMLVRDGRVNGMLVRDNSRIFCRTGPDLNACLVEIEGDFFTQFEIMAGITFRF
jgi:hypothetical protein